MAKNFIEDIAFGAQGSTYTASSSAAITPPANNVYVAIYMLTDTTFDNTTGLVGSKRISFIPLFVIKEGGATSTTGSGVLSA